LLIADTGVRSATRLPVGEVRRRWQAEPARYEALYDGLVTTGAGPAPVSAYARSSQ
jgi:mevalonate kinase